MTIPARAGVTIPDTPAPQATELHLTIAADLWMTENSNRRAHWSVKAKRVKALRELAVKEAIRNNLVIGLDRAHVTAHITYPDKRARDTHNCLPVLKALIDGLVTDYGMLPDDNDRHLIGPDLRSAGVTKGQYTVRLVITPEGKAA